MKFCCMSKKTEQDGSIKMKKGQKVSSILPMILTFLATQHWLHGLLFIALGGTASELMSMSMDDMAGFNRVMMVMTLVTVLWSIYQLIQDGFKNKGMIIMTSISSLVGIGYVMMTLVNTGW